MKDSTRRTLRTAYQSLLALIAIVPLLLSDLGVTEQAASVVVAVTLATKVVNALEDAGVIPAWLKESASE